MAVRWYVACALSYRDIEELMNERGVKVDHRFIKKITRPMLGFKSFASAEATLAGIELHHIIRKGQLELNESTSFEQFYALAG